MAVVTTKDTPQEIIKLRIGRELFPKYIARCDAILHIASKFAEKCNYWVELNASLVRYETSKWLYKLFFHEKDLVRFLEKEGKHKLRTPRILEDDVKLAKFSIERQNDGWKTSDGVVVLAAYEDLSKPDVSMEDVTTNIDSINAVLKSVARNVIAIAEKVSSSSSSSEEEEEEKIRKKRRHEVSPDEEPPKKKFKK